MNGVRASVLGFAIVLVLTVTTGGAQRQQTQDDMAMMKQLAGTWRLVSSTQRSKDGTTKENKSFVGYIIYTDTGHMCVVTMDRNRPNWKSEFAPTADELKSTLAAGLDFSAYCATVEVHAKEGFELHHTEIDKIPNNVGRTKKRWFTLQGNRLTLRVDPEVFHESADTVSRQPMIYAPVRDRPRGAADCARCPDRLAGPPGAGRRCVPD